MIAILEARLARLSKTPPPQSCGTRLLPTRVLSPVTSALHHTFLRVALPCCANHSIQNNYPQFPPENLQSRCAIAKKIPLSAQHPRDTGGDAYGNRITNNQQPATNNYAPMSPDVPSEFFFSRQTYRNPSQLRLQKTARAKTTLLQNKADSLNIASKMPFPTFTVLPF